MGRWGCGDEGRVEGGGGIWEDVSGRENRVNEARSVCTRARGMVCVHVCVCAVWVTTGGLCRRGIKSEAEGSERGCRNL